MVYGYQAPEALLVPIFDNCLWKQRKMAKTPRDNRIPIMMSHEELTAIDDWRYANRIATRSDAIRRLAQMALAIGPTLQHSVIPQANSLNDIAYSALLNMHALINEIAAGEHQETATPRNILLDGIDDTTEIYDNIYNLMIMLTEISNNMELYERAVGRSTIASDRRKNYEEVGRLTDDLFTRREEIDRDLLREAIEDAATDDEREALNEVSDEERGTMLSKAVDEVYELFGAGQYFLGRAFDNARGVPTKALGRVLKEWRDRKSGKANQ